jgi:lipopolysaccharide/colanic/teichoic acid biosynthesis glycosyltransferase
VARASRSHRVARRAFDLAVCLLLLPVVLPLLALCALAVFLESPTAPVHIIGVRVGKDGARFRVFKFRTMVPNAESLTLSSAQLNERPWPDFKITNDPRMTRVGRILRRTGLDELPRFINVVLGQMSLVEAWRR